MSIWGKFMEELMGGLKDQKISLAVLGLVATALVYAYAWADDKFASQSEVEQLKTLIIDHTEEFRINNASQIIRDLKTDIRIAKATNAPEVELRRLDEQLHHAEQYKECLVLRRPNCKHLRDVE
jgi:type II secretory pathway pseudopilin PulG